MRICIDHNFHNFDNNLLIHYRNEPIRIDHIMIFLHKSNTQLDFIVYAQIECGKLIVCSSVSTIPSNIVSIVSR